MATVYVWIADLLCNGRVVVFCFCLWPYLTTVRKRFTQHRWERQQAKIKLDESLMNEDDRRKQIYL